MGHKTKHDANSYPMENLFGKILSPFERFLKSTTAGGLVLLGASLLAIILANLTFSQSFLHDLWGRDIVVGIGGIHLNLTLHALVNEGLMTLFFLVVGLELKREIMVGELSSLKDAALPVMAALGGMIAPAVIYYAFNPSGPEAAGWGIPMATDIAFAVGIMVLLSWRVPKNLIVFLTALAIADDLGAVVVIALFYTQAIDMTAVGRALVIIFLLLLINRGGIRSSLPYAFLGVSLWFFLLSSGIHATIAGIILAFAIPSKPAFSPFLFDLKLTELRNAFHNKKNDEDSFDNPLSDQRMALIAENLEKAAIKVQSPQQRIEHALTPWVTFFVIPLFALANAGINFSEVHFTEAILHPVTMGVAMGLVIGKFAGILGMSWLAVKLNVAKLPANISWVQIAGAAWLGGIGFTMSMFIGQLAFPGHPALMAEAKLGIIVASTVCASMGLLWLYISSVKV
ncbi:MAG: Na+/H+ antiporter NhaA, partial [Syntrophales bacterium]|nr:Na+/H+ antiporter NhaA [Syntrophales bacterium]